MEQIRFGGRRVVGFGVGGVFDDAGDFLDDVKTTVFGGAPIFRDGPLVGSSHNPEYHETTKITGQEVDPSAPPEAPAGPCTNLPSWIQNIAGCSGPNPPMNLQQACASIPREFQAIAGCSNANTKLKPGESATTAPASVLTLPFGGGVDADGKPIKSPFDWFEEHKTAIIVAAVAAGTLMVGAIAAPIVMETLAVRKMARS